MVSLCGRYKEEGETRFENDIRFILYTYNKPRTLDFYESSTLFFTVFWNYSTHLFLLSDKLFYS